MKKLLLISAISFSVLFAQNIAINDNGVVGNTNAILDVDVSTNNKGVLIPRLSTAQRTAMNPSLGVIDEGLTVYDETTNSFWFWDGTQWVQLQNVGGANWAVLGNTGTNPAINFIGTTDNQPLVIRTNNTEKIRVLANGNVGVGVTNPAYNLEINGTFGYGNGTSGSYRSRTETRDNAGQIATQSGFFETSIPVNYPAGATSWWHLIDTRHSNNGNNYSLQIAGSFFDQELWFRKTNNNGAQAWSRLLTSTTGWTTLGNAGTNATINFVGTTDNVDFVTRTNNTEKMRVTTGGSVGIGTTTPAVNARLQVVGGSIMPQTGDNINSGIYFPTNPGGGGGDEAFIRHYVEAGENTKLVIANLNDPDDDISLRTGANAERVQINGNGTVYLNRGVFFDCNDCGGVANGQYDMVDGAGGNWGDLSIQGRVISTNSNLHLSPPGGSKVIINSTYRSAGGAGGTTGLDIEDGGIRMRKNYMYFQRYLYCGGCYGVGSATYALGNWDFCAVAQVGFKNTNSTTDEDDDVQCAVYPAGAFIGEQQNDTYYYTEQFNTKRSWNMYFEGFADTNGITCAASCMNFE